MAINHPKINILLTFDYELPLGGITKSFDHSLFQPTQQLLDFAQRMQVPLVLFADILSYTRFREKGISSYTNGFREQLQSAVSNQHDVQLHLHPHWLETEVNEHTFEPSDKFMLADFKSNDDQRSIDNIISTGIQELTTICREVDKKYASTAYRGGGYNLAPCTAEIIRALTENGIRYDSSIVPGYYFLSAQSKVDFRNVPGKPNWYVSSENDLSEEGNQGLWEVPIASIPKHLFEVPTSFKLKKYAHRAPEARGRMIHSATIVSFREKFRTLMANRMLTIDNYTYSPEYLMKILNHHVRKFREYDEISLALIGHPKSMGKYAFELLERFILDVYKTYDEQAKFTTFKSLKTPADQKS